MAFHNAGLGALRISLSSFEVYYDQVKSLHFLVEALELKRSKIKNLS